MKKNSSASSACEKHPSSLHHVRDGLLRCNQCEEELRYQNISATKSISQVFQGPHPGPGRWKAEQRDWLLAKLRRLKDLWLAESESSEQRFSPDPILDRAAKARTGGCARQLEHLLEEIL